MSLILFIYFADIVENFKGGFQFVICLTLGVSIMLYISALFSEVGFYNKEEGERFKEKVTKFLKPVLISLFVVGGFTMLLPSKQALHLMGGVYVGTQILESEKTNVLLDKSYKALEVKLDEMIKKGDENERK